MASNISKKRKVRRASSRTSFFEALFAHYLRPTMEYERLSEPSEIEWLTIYCEGELCVRWIPSGECSSLPTACFTPS